MASVGSATGAAPAARRRQAVAGSAHCAASMDAVACPAFASSSEALRSSEPDASSSLSAKPAASWAPGE